VFNLKSTCPTEPHQYKLKICIQACVCLYHHKMMTRVKKLVWDLHSSEMLRYVTEGLLPAVWGPCGGLTFKRLATARSRSTGRQTPGDGARCPRTMKISPAPIFNAKIGKIRDTYWYHSPSQIFLLNSRNWSSKKTFLFSF